MSAAIVGWSILGALIVIPGAVAFAVRGWCWVREAVVIDTCSVVVIEHERGQP